MKRLISVLLIAILSLGVLASCGEKDNNQNVKEVSADIFVDRFINAAKEQAQNAGSPSGDGGTGDNTAANVGQNKEPEVVKQEGSKYNTTTITYDENETLDIFSNPETGEVNGANLRMYSYEETREADLNEFFYQVANFIRMCDPSISEDKLSEVVEKFRNAVPDDPTAEGYTGMCTYTIEVNGLSYLAYYDFTGNPASCELLLS